jgi:hypothetical protein
MFCVVLKIKVIYLLSIIETMCARSGPTSRFRSTTRAYTCACTSEKIEVLWLQDARACGLAAHCVEEHTPYLLTVPYET